MGITNYFLSRIPSHVFLIYLLCSRRFLFGPLDIDSSCTILWISLQWTDLTSYLQKGGGKRGNLDRILSLATPNILTANNPALVALLTVTVATGTPLGICIANKCVNKKRRLWWCLVQSFWLCNFYRSCTFELLFLKYSTSFVIFLLSAQCLQGLFLDHHVLLKCLYNTK